MFGLLTKKMDPPLASSVSTSRYDNRREAHALTCSFTGNVWSERSWNLPRVCCLAFLDVHRLKCATRQGYCDLYEGVPTSQEACQEEVRISLVELVVGFDRLIRLRKLLKVSEPGPVDLVISFKDDEENDVEGPVVRVQFS